jgi:hypothetical protein
MYSCKTTCWDQWGILTSDSQRIWALLHGDPPVYRIPLRSKKASRRCLLLFLVAFGIFPGPGQISDGFVFCPGNVNGSQFTGTMQTGQHQGIPAVIFDLFATWLGNPRWCHDITFQSLAGEVTVDLIATGAGFIHKV